MPAPRPEVQYATLAQQGESAEFGMWIFLATEVLFFGGLITGYAAYRTIHAAAFVAAAQHAVLAIGAANTALLLTSSLTMVLAIRAAEDGAARRAGRLLGATALLGIGFLALKGYEYYLDYEEHLVPALDFRFEGPFAGPAELFWLFYFYATALHSVHLAVGVGLVLVMAGRARRGAFGPGWTTPLEVTGLYWSFVDLMWVVLFALIYPVGRG